MIKTPPIKNIHQQVSAALHEDIGQGDITAHLIQPATMLEATVICRDFSVICGIPWFNEVFNQLDPSVSIKWFVSDGDTVQPQHKLCHIQGNARAILTGERSALNFLQTLSATATRTFRYVEKIKHTNTRLLDTRKTIPLLRDAQKYAVVCGQGHNHRIGLYDGILIKENHIAAAGSISAVIRQAKKLTSTLANKPIIEIEVENLDEVQQALDAGADQLLLDNFSIEQIQQAVLLNNNKAYLEASGNITLNNIQQYAEQGIHYISIGDLTKNIQAIDLSMRFSAE
jgi:nicotinate-nucleotide pyrophosphorylase (carboxylating)